MMAALKLSLTFFRAALVRHGVPLVTKHPPILHFQQRKIKTVKRNVSALGDSDIELDIWKCVQRNARGDQNLLMSSSVFLTSKISRRKMIAHS